MAQGPEPARRSKGRLADHQRTRRQDGLREAVPLPEYRGDLHRGRRRHPVLPRHDLRAAQQARSAPLALPHHRAPGNAHPAYRQVLTPRWNGRDARHRMETACRGARR